MLQDNSPVVDEIDTKYVQSVVGALLYYARAINPTILPALSSIATQQSKPTINVMRTVWRLLDYVATYSNVRTRYYASNMQLYIDYDAAYLMEDTAKSRVAGYRYFKFGRQNRL